jgi:hypothetical protein
MARCWELAFIWEILPALEENERRVLLVAMVAEIFFATRVAVPPVETAPAAIRAMFAMQNGHMVCGSLLHGG